MLRKQPCFPLVGQPRAVSQGKLLPHQSNRRGQQMNNPPVLPTPRYRRLQTPQYMLPLALPGAFFLLRVHHRALMRARLGSLSWLRQFLMQALSFTVPGPAHTCARPCFKGYHDR